MKNLVEIINIIFYTGTEEEEGETLETLAAAKALLRYEWAQMRENFVVCPPSFHLVSLTHLFIDFIKYHNLFFVLYFFFV
jgi:hypothetical protein